MNCKEHILKILIPLHLLFLLLIFLVPLYVEKKLHEQYIHKYFN